MRGIIIAVLIVLALVWSLFLLYYIPEEVRKAHLEIAQYKREQESSEIISRELHFYPLNVLIPSCEKTTQGWCLGFTPDPNGGVSIPSIEYRK